MELKNERIRSALEPFGVEVDDQLAEQIRIYVRMLLSWNQRINLTSVTDPQQILERHFGESMYGARLLARPDGVLADVGSGAGFPGLALKLVCPALGVKLIEPTLKKAVFLSEVVRTLGITRVEVLKDRIENLGPLQVDCVTARAVGGLEALLEWANRNIAASGQVLLWLGAADAAAARGVGGWSWSESIAIPRSEKRVILSGLKAAL